ncbi:MAG: c-type cytochrome [Thermonemataceae bacterium]
MNYKHITWIVLLTVGLASCGQDPNDTGVEYAPNMYHSIPYEPLSQKADNPNKINDNGLNMRKPVKGTIARRNYKTTYVDNEGKEYDLGLMIYNTHRDSIEWAQKNLKNPLPANEEIIAEGKVLYERYCQACHGAKGDGNGKVGIKYTGVANLAAGQVAKYNGGHIFHVITHGKGRMWPHASQVSPVDRWKIVEYVHVLQGQQDESGVKAGEEAEKEEEAEVGEPDEQNLTIPEGVDMVNPDSTETMMN